MDFRPIMERASSMMPLSIAVAGGAMIAKMARQIMNLCERNLMPPVSCLPDMKMSRYGEHAEDAGSR